MTCPSVAERSGAQRGHVVSRSVGRFLHSRSLLGELEGVIYARRDREEDQDTDIVIQQARYDAQGRRVRKVVTNSGVHDGTTVYYYNGCQIVETRDGSGNLTMQVYHGTQYIDELVALRLPHGRAYVHQDANWNVIALTDLKGATLERYYYSPYGELEVVAETYFGDYNADGFIDADDAANLCTNGCTCSFTSAVTGDCRVFDFDCDGDLDNADKHTLADLYTGLSADMQNRRVPSTTFSPTGNLFAHQGLVLDAEIRSYQNRMRQYNPLLKRFMQRDPLVLGSVAAEVYENVPNVYDYLHANPLVKTDPSGMSAGDPCTAACTAAHNRGIRTCSAISRWSCFKRAKCFTCLKSATEFCTACCTGGVEWPPGSGTIVGPDDATACASVHSARFSTGPGGCR